MQYGQIGDSDVIHSDIIVSYGILVWNRNVVKKSEEETWELRART